MRKKLLIVSNSVFGTAKRQTDALSCVENTTNIYPDLQELFFWSDLGLFSLC
jgi:hypothetical protein